MKELLLILFVVTVLAVGIYLNSIKYEDEDLTRNQKRNARVRVGDKEIKALEYIRITAHRLPVMYHHRTGLQLDHYSRMKEIYMRRGNIKDVDKYIEMVIKRAKKEAKNKGIKIIKS